MRVLVGLLAVILSVGPVSPPRAAETAVRPDPKLIADLVAANHILYDQGVVDGFGHVSVRNDKDPNRYLMARSMAPGLVTGADILEYDLDSNPLNALGRQSYLERFIHGEIYKVRPDVKAIIHSHSPAVIPFGATGVPMQPIFHMSAFLGGGVPVFDIRSAGGMTNMLVSNPALGQALAKTLGDRPVALMRGHGSVAVGNSLQQVVFRAVYTEVNAKLQGEAMRLGTVTFLAPEEATKAAAVNDAVMGRAWDLWKRKVMQGEGAAAAPSTR